LQDRWKIARNRIGLLLLLILGRTFPAGTAFAKKQPKSYPETGKIVGSGSNQVAWTGPTTVVTETRTYGFRLWETSRAILQHARGMRRRQQDPDRRGYPLPHGEGLGVYISMTDSEAGQPRSFEQKPRILRAEMKPDAKPADTPASPPEKTEAKTQ